MSARALTIADVLPRGKQAWSIREATARINLWVGAVRSGKTYSSLWRWLDYVRNGPPGNLVMTGRTERTLKRNILDELGQLLGPSRFRHVMGAGECFIFGRRIYLYGANDERSASKIQGMTAAGAYCDEVTTYPESFWMMLLSRLSVKGSQIFATTNPDAPRHWLKLKFIDRAADVEMKVFEFRLDDNPALDPAYVAALRKQYVGLWYKRYILGLWALAEGAVYDMFDEDRHLIDAFPADDEGRALILRSLGGADYGTSNPTVFLRLSREVGTGRYIAHDEWRWDSVAEGRQMTDAQYSAAYRDWVGDVQRERRLPDLWPEVTLVDPSAASFRLQLSRDGVPGVTAADNDVLDGIRDVAAMLGAGELVFHRDSTRTAVEEMMSYAWDAKAQARGDDRPLKVSDHGPDVTRYLVRHVYAVPPLAAAGSDADIAQLYGRRRSVWN